MSYEQQVWNAWTAGIVFATLLVAYLVLSHRAVDHGPTLLARGIAHLIMLREQRKSARAAVSALVAATSTNDGQRTAMLGNADNPELSGNAVADPVPSEARDIIRMQAKAEDVVALLKSAKMTNKAEAIELIFNCSRSGRPNSTYQQAAALVDRLTDRYPHRTPEQEQSRVEVGLTTH